MTRDYATATPTTIDDCGPATPTQNVAAARDVCGGSASAHPQGGLAVQARRTHQELASALLHPTRRRLLAGLQGEAGERGARRADEQLQRRRQLPDPVRGAAEALHIRRAVLAVGLGHRADVPRGHGEGPTGLDGRVGVRVIEGGRFRLHRRRGHGLDCRGGAVREVFRAGHVHGQAQWAE